MIHILALLIVALAAAMLAVVTVRRPLICCPAAGVAAGVLLVLAAELAFAGDRLVAVAVLLPGLVAGGWGLWHGLADANRRREAAEQAERERAWLETASAAEIAARMQERSEITARRQALALVARPVRRAGGSR